MSTHHVIPMNGDRNTQLLNTINYTIPTGHSFLLLWKCRDIKHFPTIRPQHISVVYPVDNTRIEYLILKLTVWVADLHLIKQSLNELWLGIRILYPTISEIALNILLPFCNRCLCEMVFPALMFVKPRYWSTLKDIANIGDTLYTLQYLTAKIEFGVHEEPGQCLNV